jgi:hypothetical protein
MLRRLRSLPRAVALVGLLVAVIVGSTFALGSSSLIEGSHPGAHPALRDQVAAETATCASINSNVSLNRTYLYVYQNLSGSNSSAGPNGTPGVGQAGYPNVSTGERQLHDAWVSICESAAYETLYQQFGSAGITSGLQLDGSSGHYDADYGYIYLASCSNSADFSSTGCEYLTSWYIDLATGGVTGPITTSGGTPLGGPGSNGTSQAPGGGIGAPPLFGLPGIEGYVVLVAIAAAVGSLVAVRLRARGRDSELPTRSDPPSDPSKPRATAIASFGTPSRQLRGEAPRTEASDDPLGDVY